MSKKLNSYLKKKLKGIDLAGIADILLFGSAVKGKEFPRDIDLCVVFKEKISENVISDIENRLREFNIHVSSLTINNFFRKPHSLMKTILVEGVSIFAGKLFIQNFGFSSYALYSYDLSKLKLSEKVRFVYLMKGRKEAGIVEKMDGEWIADSCFIVPIQKDNEILTILKKWQIPFKRKEVLVH
jgi:predicted nucleotidyltransferase